MQRLKRGGGWGREPRLSAPHRVPCWEPAAWAGSARQDAELTGNVSNIVTLCRSNYIDLISVPLVEEELLGRGNEELTLAGAVL